MEFTDAHLAQQIGIMVINFWRVLAERDALKAQLMAQKTEAKG